MRRFFHLGLLERFALAGAIPIVLLGLVLAQYLRHQIQHRALGQAEQAASLIARVAFQPHLAEQDLTRGLTPRQIAALDRVLHTKGGANGVARIKIWNRGGQIVYSDNRRLIGHRFLMFNGLRDALTGTTGSAISSLRRSDNGAERKYGRLLEVYLPIEFEHSTAPAGAFDVYLPYEPLATAIRNDTRTLYALLAGGLALLYGALFRIVAGASRRLREQAEELREQAREKEHQALHDALTGLPNRTLFADRVVQALAAARRDEVDVALLLMDLDRFKEINDTLGHQSGDLLLRELGRRLRKILRASDTVARLGGDEFGLLLREVRDRQAVDDVVAKVQAEVQRPFFLQGLPLAVESSIGVAMFPRDGADVETLLQRADVAMYVAKRANEPYRLYEASQDEHDPERLRLVGELRRAMDQRELSVYYQPKADLRTEAVVGTEALVRWIHPSRGVVPPDEFVPLAQRTGLIMPMTMYVLEEAIRQCAVWQRQGVHLATAVNLAPKTLAETELPTEIERLLDLYGVAPGYLSLEITETTIMHDPFRALATLRRLNEMGIRLAIDDFGTGYSSLSYLKRLPVHEVKIDKTFIMNMVDDADDAAIVRSTIDLARNLGLEVVAEGVETEEVRRQLIALGCDVMQGYHLSRPLPPDEIARWLEQQGVRIAPPAPAPATAVARG
jgi:diguanylate cyclase (GGDEF)-like protein